MAELGRFRTILADPPWPLKEARSRPWVMGAGGRRSRATVMPYEVMSMEAMKALPVADLAHEDCRLFMWVVPEFHRNGGGVELAKAWGFTVTNEIIWEKPNYGMGYFPRPGHEPLFVCRRGKPTWNDVPEARSTHSVQKWNVPRMRGNGGKCHSQKPDAAIDLIERVSPGPYVELFARRARFNWAYWGDQSLGTAELVTSATPTETGESNE